MYTICWATETTSNWEIVDGEDAMQQRVDELKNEGATTVLVFNNDDELKWTIL